MKTPEDIAVLDSVSAYAAGLADGVEALNVVELWVFCEEWKRPILMDFSVRDCRTYVGLAVVGVCPGAHTEMRYTAVIYGRNQGKSQHTANINVTPSPAREAR